MKPRVLVINPPFLTEPDFIDYPYLTGLAALSNAAALRERGFDVSVADSQALPGSGVRPQGGGVLVGCEARELLESVDGDFAAVVTAVPPFLKPHAPDRFSRGLFSSIRARFPKARLVAADCWIGGMHRIEYDPKAFLRAFPMVDAVIQREGEAALPDLLCAEFRRGETPRAAVVGGPAAGGDADRLPPPAWDLISVEGYEAFLERFFSGLGRQRLFPAGTRALPAMASRGCPFRCSFCTSNPDGWKPAFRPHSLAYLRRHFLSLRDSFGAKRLILLDDCANFDPARFKELLALLKSLRLACEFPNGLRADRLDLASLKLLKGLSSSVTVSAESGDPKALSSILRKGLDLPAVERVAAWCRGLKFPLGIHYMAAFPGETPESLNKTFEHALRMKEAYGATPLLQNCVPIPGSALAESCARSGSAAGFDPRRFYRRFQGRPVVDTRKLPADMAGRMIALFRRRLAACATEKLIVNLTYQCLNDCWFCAVGGRPKRHAPARAVLELLRRYRKAGAAAVDFDGGEPTLHPRLFQLIRVARGLGYGRVTLTTNGRRLADRGFASRLLLSGLTDLLVSLHGHTPELHEAHTRSPGSFAETVQGIRHAARLKPGRVTLAVNAMVTDLNSRRLPELLRFVRGLGAAKVNLQFITPFGRASSSPPRDEAALYRRAAAAARSSRGLKVELVNALPCLLAGLLPGWAPETGKHGRDMAFVDAPPMNLARYLDGRRRRKAACRSCEFAAACAGFQDFS
ncbi:MAG: radical SAM protein [Elusimicrobia bacterium]|nr:radical SAM protein [Elusimicrobiota bacterium]